MKNYEDAILNNQESEANKCSNKCRNQCMQIHSTYNPNLRR